MSVGEKQNVKSIEQKAGGGMVGNMQEEFSVPLSTSLVQPFDRNFVLHWKTRAVCFCATNNSWE